MSAVIHGLKAERNVFRLWLVDQDHIWIDIDGDVHRVADIHPEYAKAILKYLWRRLQAAGQPQSRYFNSTLVRALARIANQT